MAENVKFIKCTAAAWESAKSSWKTLSAGTIIFVSGGNNGTKTVPSTIYITNGTDTPDCYAVNTNITDVSYAGTELTFNLADGTTKKINIGLDEQAQAAIEALKSLLNEDGELDFNLNYQPGDLDDELATLEKVGGIKVGTTVDDLKKLTLSEIFTELLFPDVDPTATVGTVSLSTGFAKTIEVGAELPQDANFTKTFNRGTWKIGNPPKEKTWNYYGEKTSDELYYNAKGTPLPATAETPGNYNYYYYVAYAAGDIPCNNKGKELSAKQQPAGNKTSSAVTINATYPYYLTTASSKVNPAKQGLLNWNTSAGSMAPAAFTLPPSNGTDSFQIIKVPRPLTVLQQEHPTIANTWIDIAKSGDGFVDWEHTTDNIKFGTNEQT